jgi:hypothetical protein
MTIVNRYHADITLRLRLPIDAADMDSAEQQARSAALRRPGVRPEHLHTVNVTRLSDLELEELGNRHAWQEHETVRSCGTFDQRTRWTECVLPEEELLGIARAELFRPFGMLEKRRPMVFADIPHPTDTRGVWTCLQPVPKIPKDASALVTWETLPGPCLTQAEYRTLCRIHEIAAEVQGHPWMKGASAEAVSFEAREHRGTCKKCGGMTYERSALVTVLWAGRRLSREYVL